MRVAPLGAFFADASVERVVSEARRSAAVTHCHPAGKAGAAAVSVAAWLAARSRGQPAPPREDFFRTTTEVLDERLEVREGIEAAALLPPTAKIRDAVLRLGNGSKVVCQDTVPLALWIASFHLDDFQGAVLTAIEAGGDTDTIGAIVGGIIAARVGVDGIPEDWRSQVEPVPL